MVVVIIVDTQLERTQTCCTPELNLKYTYGYISYIPMEQNGRVVRGKNDQVQARALYVRPDLIRPDLSSSNPTTLVTWPTPKVFPIK